MPRKRNRPYRVRTKNTNRRPALKLSTLDPQDLSLREGEARLIVCPDCRTWRRLMGETQLKIREHGDDKGATYVPCPGSNQLVDADITIEQWGEELLAADTTAMYRRPTAVRRKPKRPAEPAVAQMLPVAPSAAGAREAFHAHCARCASCRGQVRAREGRRLGCADGRRLAYVYVRSLRPEESARTEARRVVARELARYVRQAARNRAASWASQAGATTEARRFAKRAGTAVEEQNNTCRTVAGSVSEFRGPGVPLEPLRITA